MDFQTRVFDKSCLGIIRVNRNLEFTYANPVALEIMGAKSIQGVSIWDVVRGEEDRRTLKEQFERRKEGESGEYRIKVRRVDDARSVPVSIAATPEFDDRENMIGALSIVRNRELDEATETFHRQIETCREWEQLLRAAAAETARIVPHDLFIVSIYTRNLQQARVIFDHPREEQLQWPKRWYTLSKDLVDQMKKMSLQPVGDLNALLDRPEMQRFRQEKEVRLFLDRGIRSFIRVPVARAEKLLASVTLLSKQPNAFARAAEKLKTLPLDEAINTAIYYRDIEEHRFRFELIKRISNSRGPEEVMSAIVRSLKRHYGWQDISIYRADEVKRQFRLQARASLEDGRTYDGFSTISFDEGVLGEVYKTGKATNLGNVSEVPYFKRGRPETRSELCIPIRLAGKIRWLLNVEDDVESAFSDEDKEALQGVVDEAHSILKHLFRHFFLDKFIATASDAIFVTDMGGSVLRSNEAAAKMLQRSSVVELVGRPFEEFLAEEDRHILHCDTKSLQSHCHLVTAEKQPVDVLLSGEVHEEFGCRVFCAKDLSLMRRVEELEAVRDMFREIAALTRIPFSLLYTWLRRLRDGARDAPMSDLLEKAIRQLRKAELTYEQLVLYDGKKGAIPFNPVRLDMGTVLSTAKEELPGSDSARIVVDAPAVLPEFRGDLFQLVFVFEAVLSYLLRLTPMDEKIPVQVWATESGIQTCIRGSEPAQETHPGAPNSAQLFERRAEVDVALGEPTIRRFVEENHGGRYARRSSQDGKVEFFISLPVLERKD